MARLRGCRPKPSISARVRCRRRSAHPWGDATARARRLDFSSWDPEPAGSASGRRQRVRRRGSRRQRLGVDVDDVRAVPRVSRVPSYPEYSADFFDGEHFVMKGASPATARELIRPSFRNWFRPRYPVRLRDVPVREMIT